MVTGPEPADGLSLRPYLDILRRRWRVVLCLSALVPAVSVLVSLRQSPLYTASSEVLIRRDNLAASLTPGQVGYTDAQTAERVIETQVQLARVPALAERVVNAPDVARTETAVEFLRSSSASAKTKTDIVVLTAGHRSPAMAIRLANRYASEFSAYRRQLDTTELSTLAQSVRSQLASLAQTDGTATALAGDLQDKLRQIQTLQTLQTSSAVVVRQADEAGKVRPKPVTMGVGGLILGLMLGAGIAFLLDSLDTRVRSSSEVGALLGLPLLARLPQPPKRLLGQPRLIVAEEPESPEGEAFNFLQTSLTFANVEPTARVILFSSAIEQEGKTTTVANLGVVLANAGQRVVLVDLDHRRPSLHRFFDMPQVPGFTDVARGEADVRRTLIGVALPPARAGSQRVGMGAERSLEVLPAGSSVHSIDIDTAAEVINGLRAHADIILVDACPLLLVGETMALAAALDALVVVARLGVVRQPMLEELRRDLAAAPVRALGFVMTGAGEESGYSQYYKRVSRYTTTEDDPPSLRPVEMPQPVEAPPPAPAVAEPATAAPGPPPARPLVPADRNGWRDATAPTAIVAPLLPRDEILSAVFAAVPEGSPSGRTGNNSPSGEGVRPRRSWAGLESPSAASPVETSTSLAPGPESEVAHGGGDPGE